VAFGGNKGIRTGIMRTIKLSNVLHTVFGRVVTFAGTMGKIQ
jgi:hypothetical protein